MPFSIHKLLLAWVLLVSRYAKASLLIIAFATVFAAIFSTQNFKINSDLNTLIIPSDDRVWHADNEVYKKQFPQYQNTALVVISGADVKQVEAAGRKLYQTIKNDTRFYDFFAPQYEAFFDDRVLLAVPVEGVKQISEKVSESLASFDQLIKQPDATQYITYLQSRIIEDAKLEFLSKQTTYQLNQFSLAVNSLSNGQTVLPRLIMPFAKESDDEKHIEVISLKGKSQYSEELPNAEIIANLQKIINNFQSKIDTQAVDIHLTGEVMLSHEEVMAGLSGVEIAGAISLLLLLVILGVGIRSWSVIIAIFTMLLIGVIMTSSLGLLLVGSFNTLSLIFLVMFFGLGIDFAVHFSLRAMEIPKVIKGQDDKLYIKQSLLFTAKDIGSLLVLCGLTSATAFLAFVPTDYNGLSELGVISAAGMFVAVVLSLSFFPAWFSIFGFRITKQQSAASDQDVVNTKKSPLLAIVLVAFIILTMAAASLLEQLRFDFSVLALRDKNTEGVSTLLMLQEQEKITDYSINILLTDEQYQNRQQLITQLLELDEVSAVKSIDDIVPKFQRLKMQYITPVLEQLKILPALPEKPVITNSVKLIGQIDSSLESIDIENQEIFIDEDQATLLRFTHSLQALRKQPQLVDKLNRLILQGLQKDVQQLITWFSQTPFTVNDLPDDVRARFVSRQQQYLLTLLPNGEISKRDDMEAFIEAVADVAPNISGRSVVEWGVADIVLDAFVQAVIYAVVIIFLLLCCYFRSLLLPLLVMTPLLLTSLFTFAVVVLTGLTLNMANILVVPLIFGLGVDTGIHVVHRYIASQNLRGFYFSSTSRAVVISALTTIGTFLSLSLSPHKGAQSVGVLLAVAISLMLLVTFALLPVLLELFASHKRLGKPQKEA